MYKVIRASSDFQMIVFKKYSEEDKSEEYYEMGASYIDLIDEEEALMSYVGMADSWSWGKLLDTDFKTLEDLLQWADKKRNEYLQELEELLQTIQELN